MLAAAPLDPAPQRIAIGGTTGSGKSTLARRLSAASTLPYTELDALYHGPGWTERESFVPDVERVVAGERWVIEWQYRVARPMIAARADTLVWIDLPFPLVLGRLIRRTWRRQRTGVELWNGNTEPGLIYAITRSDGIVRWAFATHRGWSAKVRDAAVQHPELRIVRLRSRRDVERFARQFEGG